MKKLFVLAVMAIMAIGSAYSQSLEDVWMNLRNNQVGKARKVMDAVMVGNEQNAQAWLMKGNTYLRVYQQDQERLKKDPAYVSRTPDAIIIANEAFYQAISLDGNIVQLTQLQISLLFKGCTATASTATVNDNADEALLRHIALQQCGTAVAGIPRIDNHL